MTEHFTGDWYFVENLGEGSFGQVRLARNAKTNAEIACKVIRPENDQNKKDIEREICILKLINHPNIYKYYGHKKDEACFYIFFEYISGGELLNWIDPGFPMDNTYAFVFSSQILEAINYLHELGIAHRDIKLENIMLNENNDVKLIDFGLSTIFKYKEKERHLTKRCGSLPYTAPEVLTSEEYRAKSADIWSFGIILFVLFIGELPWDSACDESVEFRNYKMQMLPSPDWNKLSPDKKSLIEGVLSIYPTNRYTYTDIKKSLWYVRNAAYPGVIGEESKVVELASQNDMNLSNATQNEQCSNMVWLSQTNPTITSSNITSAGIDKNNSMRLPKFEAFSQPTDNVEYISSQMNSGNVYSQTKNCVNMISKKLTRFYVMSCGVDFLIKCISDILDTYLLQWTFNNDNTFTINFVDSRKLPILFRIVLNSFFKNRDGPHTLIVLFRRIRGDGLKFKKFYEHIKGDLSKLVNCADVLN